MCIGLTRTNNNNKRTRNSGQEWDKVPSQMDPITANYLMDYLFFSRDDELFRYYKKVSDDDGHLKS